MTLSIIELTRLLTTFALKVLLAGHTLTAMPGSLPANDCGVGKLYEGS